MKKLFFAIMAIGLMASASSCKKCGYCKYSNGQSNTSAVCQNSTLAAVGADEYNQAKANCSSQNGEWVLTK